MPTALVAEVARRLARRARWRPLEYAFWLAALASVFLLPGRHLILTEIAWLALFALSLDLILGYAGIISLGHAAFFGLGSYLAALLAKHGIINEPVFALVVSGLCAAVLGFATSFLVLRTTGCARIQVRRTPFIGHVVKACTGTPCQQRANHSDECDSHVVNGSCVQCSGL